MEEFNPWWRGEEDKDIEEFNSLEYKYYPRWLDQVSLRGFSLNFVLGFRKTGKTMGIKLLINELLKSHSPFSIFFFRVDILDDYRELYEVLKSYWKFKEERRIKECFIFLDEVTLLENWWRAVKVFIDEYKPKEAVFVLSGSASMFFHGKAETFSGRRGSGKIVNVLPLSFHEYFSLFKKPALASTLSEAFASYLKTGGFLGVLNKKVSEEDIILGIKNDLRLVRKSVNIGKAILGSVLEKAPSPYSYHTLARDLGISVKTVIEFLELFEEMFLLKGIFHQGLDGKVRERKEKKFIVRDPFLTRSISIWTGKELKKDFLYEWIVQEHLLRKFGEVYYYRNKYEIDCIAGSLKVEVKAGKPHRRYPKGVTILEEEDIPWFLVRLFTRSKKS